jgi:hypothetical protein
MMVIQSEMQLTRMGENICKLYTDIGIDTQNINNYNSTATTKNLINYGHLNRLKHIQMANKHMKR